MSLLGIDKRNLAAWGLNCSGLGWLRQNWLKLSGRRNILIVLAYHRVVDPQSRLSGPWDPAQISCLPQQFEAQAAYLARNFQVLSFSRLKAYQQELTPIPPLSVILTFDDGYHDNYQIVYPILKKYGLSAIIFLPADYIDRQNVFWWDKLYYVICNSQKQSMELDQAHGLGKLDLSNRDNRAAALDKLLALAKRIPDADRVALLEEVYAKAEITVDPLAFPRQAVNWGEVKEMIQGGIEFGAHTLSHPILSQLPPDKLAEELTLSRRRIQQETGQPVDCFCYPVGLEGTFNNNVVEAVRHAGFTYATTALPGLNDLNRVNPLHLKRLWVNPLDNLAVFKQRLLFPNIFKY